MAHFFSFWSRAEHFLSVQIWLLPWRISRVQPKKSSGNLAFSSSFNSCASVVQFSILLQKLLIGWSHSLKCSMQSVSNRFSDCLWTKTFTFLVVPFRDTCSVSSPSNFIMSPVTARAVLPVFLIAGFFNFFHVFRLMIDRDEPESSCRSTFFYPKCGLLRTFVDFLF